MPPHSGNSFASLPIRNPDFPTGGYTSAYLRFLRIERRPGFEKGQQAGRSGLALPLCASANSFHPPFPLLDESLLPASVTVPFYQSVRPKTHLIDAIPI